MKDNNAEVYSGFQTADQVTRRILGTGIDALDILLSGGLEAGLTHLFYGVRSLHNDLLKIAVHAQLPEEKGGLDCSTIIIDSANVVKFENITDYAFEFGLEPEEVMDRIYITRAFNSSQTYDLIMNQLDDFLSRVHAKVLMVTGLPDLYIKEGLTGEGLQQLTHMITRIMTESLKRNLFTVVSAPSSERSQYSPAGGKAIASYSQIHVYVEESKSYSKYTLAKHPQYPVRRSTRSKPTDFGSTLPLSYFLNRDDESSDE